MMPTYEFTCLKCKRAYSDLQPFDPTGKYADVSCPHCKSKRKKQGVTFAAVKFTNPKDTSKFDNFSYRAGYNLDKAQDERRAAESASHMGAAPYMNHDDISSGDYFGEVE
jgi:putative FmdB family regulatory protein